MPSTMTVGVKMTIGTEKKTEKLYRGTGGGVEGNGGTGGGAVDGGYLWWWCGKQGVLVVVLWQTGVLVVLWQASTR